DGSVGLNDTLGQRRVSQVFKLIENKVKIRADFMTRNLGKLHKQSPVKAENRKVVIYYLQEKDLAKENEILGIVETKKPEVKPKGPIVYPDKVSVQRPDGKQEEIILDVAFMKRVGEAKAGEKLSID